MIAKVEVRDTSCCAQVFFRAKIRSLAAGLGDGPDRAALGGRAEGDDTSSTQQCTEYRYPSGIRTPYGKRNDRYWC